MTDSGADLWAHTVDDNPAPGVVMATSISIARLGGATRVETRAAGAIYRFALEAPIEVEAGDPVALRFSHREDGPGSAMSRR